MNGRSRKSEQSSQSSSREVSKHKQITWPLIVGLMFALAASLAFGFLLRDDGEKEHFYPDLTSRSAYACAEVNNFVNEFDPFYNMALRSSFPSILQMNAGASDASYLQLANTAYQQASAWRVVSNWTSKDGTTNLYASSEPHVMGGHIKQHRNNWVWRLRADWGISMRMCLSNGISGNNMSCIWTTPVVATSAGVLGLLYIGIPYRAPLAPGIQPDVDISNVQYSKGFYHTNYASSARADFTKHQQLDTTSGYYLTRDIRECEFGPSYHSPDAFSFLAFPALECACSSNGKVCLVVTSDMDNASWGLLTNSSSCASLKSYWAWNTGSYSYLVYVAYNSSADKPFPMWVPISNLTSYVSSIQVASLKVMEDVTVCVENLMIQNPVPSEHQVLDKCSAAASVDITAATDSDLRRMQRSVWSPTPKPEAGSDSCLKELPPGQLDYQDKMCVSKLDASTNSALQDQIKALASASDIRFKVNKAWKNGQDNRHGAYIGVFTAFLSLLGGAFTALSKSLQAAEEGAAKWVNEKACLAWLKKFKDLGYWIKFLYRAVFLVCLPAGIVLFTAYNSNKGVKKDRDVLQAQTVSQTLRDGNVVLVTTTATVLVDPIWTTFYILCCITFLVVIGVLIWVGFRVEEVPLVEEKKKGPEGE